jgi:hypothetical protein
MAAATYRDIQQRVKANHGFTPKTCWIADVKAAHGLTRSASANRINPTEPKYPCPPDKRPAIEAALKHFGLL